MAEVFELGVGDLDAGQDRAFEIRPDLSSALVRFNLLTTDGGGAGVVVATLVPEIHPTYVALSLEEALEVGNALITLALDGFRYARACFRAAASEQEGDERRDEEAAD